MPNTPISSSVKRVLPRGLYGRAALILILPVLVVQLVVSVAFLQRHFEGVTLQMTRNIVLEMRLLIEETAAAGERGVPRQRGWRGRWRLTSNGGACRTRICGSFTTSRGGW